MLKIIRGSFGISTTKINPSGGIPDEHGVRSNKSLVGVTTEQQTEDSFVSYLENPGAHTRIHAWEEAPKISSE